MDFTADEKLSIRQWARAKGHGHYRHVCPACSQERRNKTQQCLSVTIDRDHVVMQCWHCGRSGATYLHETPLPARFQKTFTPPQYEKPKPTAVKRLDVALGEAAANYLAGRRISAKTAQVFGLVSARAFFPQLQREEDAIAFPYTKGHKIRAYPDKAFVCSQPLASLFGFDLIDLAESKDILICEGELDPLSFYEAGVVNATSVPNGASSFMKNNEDGTMREIMGFLWEARDVIDAAGRIIIATDADDPGDKLAEELARRIGRHRVWRVSYPEGCKDANDVLMKHGADALAKCAQDAVPWPVDGLYEADKYFLELDDLYDNGFADKISTGLEEVDQLISISPGLLTVVTGIPGHGKSTFVDQILVNLALKRGYVSAICSFENPPPIHIGKLMQMLYQRHFFPTDLPGSRMTKQEVEEIKPFIHRHFKFIQQDDGKKATIQSVIERIKTAVFRWGVQTVVIDPYNYLARPANAESETQWIDDILTELRLTATLYGIHIFFVAHPTKQQMDAEGNYHVPKGYSISGSAAWFSKPDFGITVHRVPNSNVVKIVNWKTRYDFLGKVGEVEVIYDNITHVYQSGDWTVNAPVGGWG